MNELSKETSPYLLQHANNPVHWKAWNETTLTQAKTSNKLIIVSIGYSACHWCHVMEHESFEDDEVAQTMNANFTSIKVDREERPDVDAVYMKAVQIMTGQGGWPLNMITLPDGRPIWGGTYFRKNQWINALEQLQEMYQSQPEKMLDYAEKLQTGLNQLSIIPETQNENTTDYFSPLIEKWKKSFDHEFGGMARAPKFMMPNNYAFLMRYGHQNNDQDLLDFVDLTLTKMAYGGLFDTIDGGFSRYSVDMKWHVPHFEKMLYDNGQLVSLYADAYKRTKNPLYKEVIEKTLAFVSREWLTAEGAFYSALDADSLNPSGKLEEGAFYVWTEEELQQILQEDFDLFRIVFNINPFGHWEHDHYVLIQSQSLETIAKQNNLAIVDIQSRKKAWEKQLFEIRENRPKPRLDDKCLTSWNALMLKGFVDAYKALQYPDYLKTALANANFIVNKLWSADGHLWRNYKNDQASINAFLEDYAIVIEAFSALYEVTFDEQWLQNAKQLTDYSLEHFYEEKLGLFRFKSALDEPLFASHFETEDNVIAASNSIMAKNLYRLSVYFHHAYYEKISRSMTKKILPTIDYPSGFSNWLEAAMNFSPEQKELAVCSPKAIHFSEKFSVQYFPNVLLAGTSKNSELPFLSNRFQPEEDLFYVCQNKSCHWPQTDFNCALKELVS
ncbi:thioredoxin domain-containing protein [Flavobacterium sp. CYK-4]|uniref:thioredoxin domain-containing protein n=1 Tax=Flavobacterium lotistagni TaxID=2709660 RepID=UPI00140DE530|nr:thioredoxin domain-containing protein [Flavobacterium lotistagni]NHM06780.1 thioredoxin domain-containing protein [Flavobacterium lotistagni]